MSDHYICFIPAEPDFIPDKESQAAAVALIQKTWNLEKSEITPETDTHIVFRDCGENFESIHCPHCRAEMDIGHWQALMDQSYSDEYGFTISTIQTPCCGKSTTLNDLYYKWPMGFSRFVLRTVDPGCEISDHLLIELESAIGSRLRVIHQMY